jgi:hypothetical protein
MARAAWSGLVSVRVKYWQGTLLCPPNGILLGYLTLAPRSVHILVDVLSFHVIAFVLSGIGRNFITGTISTAIGQLSLLLELSTG